MSNRPLYNGQVVNFTVSFTASSDTTNYTSYVVTDTLANALSYSSTTVTADGSALILDTDYTVSTNLQVLTVTVNNNSNVAGKVVVVTINSTVTDMTQVVAGELTNTATVTTNGTSGLETMSDPVTVNFETFQSYSITNTTIANRVLNAIEGQLVEFDGEFTTPNYNDAYSVVITMQLPTGTSLSTLNSSVLYGSTTPTDVGGTWSTDAGNIAKYSFTNSATLANQPIDIVLNITIDDNHTIEGSFNNIFGLAIGGNTATSSNSITTVFVKPVGTVTKAVLPYPS